jgi:hypothetical protein
MQVSMFKCSTSIRKMHGLICIFGSFIFYYDDDMPFFKRVHNLGTFLRKVLLGRPQLKGSVCTFGSSGKLACGCSVKARKPLNSPIGRLPLDCGRPEHSKWPSLPRHLPRPWPDWPLPSKQWPPRWHKHVLGRPDLQHGLAWLQQWLPARPHLPAILTSCWEPSPWRDCHTV